MNHYTNLAILVLSAGLVLGCNKSSDREPEVAANESRNSERSVQRNDMTPASGTRSAAEQLAQARCERERTCGNIGDDETYSSSQDCLARVQSDWRDDLNARECPGGINQHELDECLAQIRAESCGNPFDTLTRMAECTAGQICIEQP